MNVVFSLNDTLIETQRKLDEINEVIAKTINTIITELVPVQEIKIFGNELYHSLSQINGKTHKTFLKAWLETLSNYSSKTNTPITSDDELRVYSVANKLAEEPIALAAGAVELLEELTTKHYRLYMLATGEQGEQKKRLSDAGIIGYFTQIHVVKGKDGCIMKEYAKLDKENLWVMVGASLERDVMPSLKAGMNVIHVQGYVPKKDIFGLGRRYHRVKSLADVSATLDEINYRSLYTEEI